MDHNLFVSYILTFSILTQIGAALMALFLIRISEKRIVWILLATALTLMAVRRIIPLYRLISGDISIQPDPLNEFIGLVLSIIIAAGIAQIALLTIERRHADEELSRLNRELEQRVRERTAQLEATNQELETFAYSVSHDLRAPLRHIDGFIHLLQERTADSLDEQSRHYMATSSEAARRLGNLIDDLLAFSRMGRQEMTLQQVDLKALVQGVIRDFEPETRERSIRWNIAELPVVTGDRAMLRVVMVNLISNAVKFTSPREQAAIEIGCRNEGEETVVFVRDNGVGFDMGYVDRIFEVFQRLHNTKEFDGTGIGLANVRRVISRHGGRTWAEGKVDLGATFYFSLPRTIKR